MQHSVGPIKLPPFLAARISDLSAPSIFVMLWASTVLAHFDEIRNLSGGTVPFVYEALVFLSLLFARSSFVFLIALFVQLVNLWHYLPHPSNHWAFMGFAGIAMMAALIGFEQGKLKLYSVRDSGWFEKIKPLLCAITIMLYFSAALHKLNWDFIDPVKSCAGFKYLTNRNILVFQNFEYVLIFGCLVSEILTAIFLSFRKTWFIGLVVGFIFHSGTALIMRTFPMLMFTLYVLFLPQKTLEKVIVRAESFLRSISFGKCGLVGFIQALAIIYFVWSLMIVKSSQTFYASKSHVYYSMQLSWYALTLVIAVLTFWYLLKTKQNSLPREPILSRLKPFGWVVLILFLINNASPYLGLKTEYSMNMWSNLSTGNGTTNHLFMPVKPFRVWPYLDDIIDIKETNDFGLKQKYVDGEYLISYIMLKRYLKSRQDTVFLRYVRGGKEYVSQDATRDPIFSEPESYLFSKLIYVKDVRKDNKDFCSW